VERVEVVIYGGSQVEADVATHLISYTPKGESSGNGGEMLVLGFVKRRGKKLRKNK